MSNNQRSKSGPGRLETVEKDAVGQFARGMKRSTNNGVSSAKPRVITGQDDATDAPPEAGRGKRANERDLNREPRKPGEPEFTG